MNDLSYSILDRPVVQTGFANDDAARIIDAVAGYPLGMIQYDVSWYLSAVQSYTYACGNGSHTGSIQGD